MTLTDTGPLVAICDSKDPHHERCVRAIDSLTAPMITTLACLSEAMLLLYRGAGWPAQASLWTLIRKGAVRLEKIADDTEVERMATLMEQYQDLPMSLADASLVAVAEKLNLTIVFTMDDHFRAYQLPGKRYFHVVP